MSRFLALRGGRLNPAQRSFMFAGMMAFALLGFVTNSASALNNPIQGDLDLYGLIDLVITIAIGFLGIVAVLYFVYMGFKYVTAGGDTKQASEAREGITQAIIGIFVALIGYVVVEFVFDALNVENSVTDNFIDDGS